MFIRLTLTTAFTFSLTFYGPSVNSQTRMPEGSFLHSKPHSALEMKSTVQRDKVVKQRYARLFHLPETMVPFALGKMHLKKLTESHIYEVHFIRPGEKIAYKKKLVKKGTLVWCMPDGQPALLEVCGNPLRRSIEYPVPAYTSKIPTVPSVSVGRSALPPPPHIHQAGINGLIPSFIPAKDVLVVTDIPAAPLLPVPALEEMSLPPVYQWLSRKPFGLWGLLAPAGLLPLLAITGGSHTSIPPSVPPVISPPENSGGNELTPLSPPTVPPSPPMSVPEPRATLWIPLAIFAIGLLFVMRMLKSNRSRR